MENHAKKVYKRTLFSLPIYNPAPFQRAKHTTSPHFSFLKSPNFMKNSPPPLPLSPSSSSSSSSSSSNASTLFSSNVLHVNKPKKKPKPSKKDANQDKRHLGDGHGNVNGKRSSAFRGVTRHRWTGRYEAHLWDKHGWNYVQNKKGRQVYLGAYDDEEAAAGTYDLAALKYWGEETALNFPIDTYTKEYEEMQSMSKEEYLASLRRRSNGFSIGVCKYRGVARHHYNGRWEARIGTVFGNKFLYLGTFSTQEGAVQACDLAAIEYRGPSAVTNFDISCYIKCPQPLQKPHLPHKPKSQSPQVQEQPGTCEEAQATEVSNRFGPSTIADDNGVDEIPWSPFMDQCFNDVHPDHHIAFHRSNDPHDYCGSVGFEDDVDFLLGMSEYSNRDETEGVDEARKDCMFEDAAAEREKEDMASHMNTVPFRPHSISICS